MKIARVRIQIDMELDIPLTHGGFNLDDPDLEDRLRFFYEENHCVENETADALEALRALKALEALEAGQEFANQQFHERNPHIPDAAGVCITCAHADVKLLGVREQQKAD